MADPRCTITDALLDRIGAVNRLVGRYESLAGAKPQPKLRRTNRIRTIQGSLAIEGNTLSIDQVTAVLEGKRVLGPKKEILEVRNAVTVYERAAELDPHSIQALLSAHRQLMTGLVPDAGRWRTGAVGIFKGSHVSHLAPKAHHVQGMVKELLAFVRRSKSSPLVTSSVFHHVFEVIHPFSDGNGRMGRLWQHLLLTRFHPIFEHVPVESVVHGRQAEYYQALERADRADDSTPFVEFMVQAILEATQELLSELRLEPAGEDDRLQAARERFGREWFSRKDYQSFFMRISAPTASRDLRAGVDNGALERKGDKALARYRFR